jgi:cytochrome b involved in lipid metabolism
MSKTFTPAEVAAHNSADKGMYIIVDSSVYDVTKFVDEHPGGAKILKRVAGKDASKQFWKVCAQQQRYSRFYLLRRLVIYAVSGGMC